MRRQGPPPPPPGSGPYRGRGPPPPPPGYRSDQFLASAPAYGVEASEMEGVDLFYSVVLEDRVNRHLSGGYYLLLEHPFERVIPKPPQNLPKSHRKRLR
jgi:hypothetical protein